jgi:hypothetical protein
MHQQVRLALQMDWSIAKVVIRDTTCQDLPAWHGNASARKDVGTAFTRTKWKLTAIVASVFQDGGSMAKSVLCRHAHALMEQVRLVTIAQPMGSQHVQHVMMDTSWETTTFARC